MIIKHPYQKFYGLTDYKQVTNNDGMPKYDYQVNRGLLRWQVLAFSDSTIQTIISAAGVVIAVIIFTSVFCIRNSFAISITEKMKMYGELASVGATKKQIRKSVITEGVLLGAIRSTNRSTFWNICNIHFT